jgi:23S rRNA (pseudouridine1915-N3)-methyltransferase
MRIHLIAVGTGMPAWVEIGFQDYAKRLPPDCALRLVEIPAGKRTKNADLPRLMASEGERSLAAVPRGAQVLALDAHGTQWSTEQLSGQLDGWLHEGRDIALLVGGPEGLAPQCKERAAGVWSLSKLTLPHPLVRIVVAEQLYRAWSILKNHPYHR